MEKDEIRTGLQVAEIKRDLVDNLFYLLGKFHEVATPNDWYLAVAYTVRDRLLSRWVKSAHEYYETKARTVCYLSPEFLIGPQLGMNLLRLNSEQSFRQALQELGLNLDDIIEHEEEPGLGNGGLGRLASCFLESMATLQVPAIGYGIRYEFGIFDQELRDGWQLEVADQWLRLRSEEHTSELQSLAYLVCRLLLEKKKTEREYAPHVVGKNGMCRGETRLLDAVAMRET